MSDNANMQKDGNKLQGFTKIWNGLPMVQFKKNFIIPLIVAMGNVVMDGVPLPDTILGVDHGGHAAGAPAGTAAQNIQRRTRVRRIFSILLAHMDPNSAVYDILSTEYNNDGLLALRYIQQDGIGNIPMSVAQRTRLTKRWDNFTIQSENIKISLNTIAELGNKIRTLAKEFDPPQNNLDMYGKFSEEVASVTTTSYEVLNAIKYLQIPSAQERRNGQTAQAAQVAEEEEQPAADDVEDDESDADSKYDAQFAAVEGDENDYHEW